MINETSKLDLRSHLDQPLNMDAVDQRMRAEAPFMNPPIERFHLLDAVTLRDRIANLLHGGKRKLALGALTLGAAAATIGGIEAAASGSAAEHGQLAKQGAQEAHTYLAELNGQPQSGFDVHGNRIVFQNGQPRVISKADLNQTSGNK